MATASVIRTPMLNCPTLTFDPTSSAFTTKILTGTLVYILTTQASLLTGMPRLVSAASSQTLKVSVGHHSWTCISNFTVVTIQREKWRVLRLLDLDMAEVVLGSLYVRGTVTLVVVMKKRKNNGR